MRKKISVEIKESFNPRVNLTIHWDGKIFSALTSKNKVDRLAVLVSGEGVSKLLGVPAITSGTGESQANAVYKLIEDWGLINRITSMCFDTTASNTGLDRGACSKLEEKLGRKLYPFACRHHILELLPAAVFNLLFGASSGPNIKLFQKFSSVWDTLDHDNHQSAMRDSKIANFLTPLRDNIIEFIKHQLNNY